MRNFIERTCVRRLTLPAGFFCTLVFLTFAGAPRAFPFMAFIAAFMAAAAFMAFIGAMAACADCD